MIGWTRTRLGECCEIVSGATPSTSTSTHWDGDICWATPKDLSRLDGAYISDTPRKLTQVGLDSCSAAVLPPDSVLFSSRAPIGHVAINTVSMATNQGFKSFIPKPDRIRSKYLYHWLRANRPFLESLGNGATFKEVSKAIVERIELPLPPISEQERIAEILDKADALRVRHRAALAQLDTLTDSIFLDLFGDPMSNPKGWPAASLLEILALPLRNGLSPSHGGKVTARVLTLSAITGAAFNAEAWKIARFQAPPPPEQSVRDDDFLICRGNGNPRLVGKGYFPPDRMPDVTFPDTIIAARIDPQRIEPRFLQHVWNSTAVRRQIESLARTTNGTYKVNQSTLEGVTFVVPPRPLQHTYAQRASRVDALRRPHLRSLTELDSLFASLQHRAFRGEL